MQAFPYTTVVQDRRWLSPKAFELVLSRPHGFIFKAGQRIGIFANISGGLDLSAGIGPGLEPCVDPLDVHVLGQDLDPALELADLGRAS